jgi:hypothetical protein
MPKGELTLEQQVFIGALQATIAQQRADLSALVRFVGSVDTFYTFPIDGEQAWWENDINADGEPDEEYWDVLNRRADIQPIIERYRAEGE